MHSANYNKHVQTRRMAHSVEMQTHIYCQSVSAGKVAWILIKVRTDSSTEFGSNPILIDRIRIESAAGSNPILIRTAVDHAVDFNERVTAFTTGRACAAISDINGGNATYS